MGPRRESQGQTLLARSELFSSLEPKFLTQFIECSRPEDFDAEQVVFRQGDSGGDMFIIVSGQVAVSGILRDGNEILLRRLGAGDAFGEISLFDNGRRTASITTLEPSSFLVITRAAFTDFVQGHPEVAIGLLAALSKRFRKTDEALKEALSVNIPARLAGKLHSLLRAYGRQTRKGIRIDTAFSVEELADITGLSSSVITKQLRIWQESGLVIIDHHYITITDVEELERLQ